MPGLGLVFWMTVAFGVVLYILKKYAWKPILNVLDAREKHLAKSFSDAKRIEHEVTQLAAMKSEKIAEAEKIYEEITVKAERDAEKIIADAREKAEQEAHEISEKTDKMMQQFKEEAFRKVKGQISDLSIEIAEKVLLEELSDRDRNSRYVSSLLEKIAVN